MDYGNQVIFALLLGLPVACVVWTVTQEEVFKELREALQAFQRRHAASLWRRKLAYLPTCPYCFSHYVAAFFILLLQFKMLTGDWRGYCVSLFTVVLIANTYLSAYHLLRVALRRSRALADQAEADLQRTRKVANAVEVTRNTAWTTLGSMRNGHRVHAGPCPTYLLPRPMDREPTEESRERFTELTSKKNLHSLAIHSQSPSSSKRATA